MLYTLFNTISNWSILDQGSLIALCIFLALAGICLYFTPIFMRVVLGILMGFEILFMTPSYACLGSSPFKRIAGTEQACVSSTYDQYLTLNFGINHWYILLSYALIVFFILFKVERITASIRDNNAAKQKFVEQQNYEMEQMAESIRKKEKRKILERL